MSNKGKANKKIIVLFIATIIIITSVVVLIVFKKNENPPLNKMDSVNLFPENNEKKATETTKDRRKMLSDAKKVNDKSYGWLSVEGTNISYPVILDRESDNAYWETRNLKNEVVDNTNNEGNETAIYASCYTVISDKGKLVGESYDGKTERESKNLVVYGHNWNNLREPFYIGNAAPEAFKMFAQLPSFTDLEFSKNNQIIRFTTEEDEKIYQVFSVMYTEPNWSEDVNVEYFEENPSDKQLETMIAEMKERSVLDFDTTVTKDDELITLSTCTRIFPEEKTNQRYVVVGKLISEKDAEKKVSVEINPDIKKPIF